MKVAVAGEPFGLGVPSIQASGVFPGGVERLQGDLLVASFPGVFSVQGQLVVVLHRAYRGRLGTTEEQLRLAVQHVGALYLYATGARISVQRSLDDLALKSIGNGLDLLDQLEAGLALWTDFKRNGVIVLAERRCSRQIPGRIDWRRSQVRGVPVHGPGGEVYQQIVHRRVCRSPRHPLARVHQAAIQDIARLFALGAVPAAPALSATEARVVLEVRGREVFGDRLRSVVRLLRRYYSPRSGFPLAGTTATHALLATSYEQVWEEMLRVVLGHEERHRDRFSGRYHVPGEKPRKGITLKPDVLVRTRLADAPVRLVLDAKDYREGSWPGTADLSKQMLYRLMLSDRIYKGGEPLETIGNAFLFPAAVAGGIRERGVHRMIGTVELGEPGLIVGLDVDLSVVTQGYLAGRVDEDILQKIGRAALRPVAVNH